MFDNLLNIYLENFNSLDTDSNLEMEVRFGTRNINRISKIDYNNVIQVLLAHGFELKNQENYILRIQSEYIEGKISGIRTEING